MSFFFFFSQKDQPQNICQLWTNINQQKKIVIDRGCSHIFLGPQPKKNAWAHLDVLHTPSGPVQHVQSSKVQSKIPEPPQFETLAPMTLQSHDRKQPWTVRRHVWWLRQHSWHRTALPELTAKDIDAHNHWNTRKGKLGKHTFGQILMQH